MEQKFEGFDMQEAMRLANSDAGKQLMTMLKNQQNSTMQSVMDSVKNGDMEQAKRSLSAFMADPKTKALLEKLQEESNERNGR